MLLLLMLLLQRRAGRRELATLNNRLLVNPLVVYVLLLLLLLLLLLVQTSRCHRHRLFLLHQIMLIRPSKSEWILMMISSSTVEVRFPSHRVVVCIELYPPRRLLVLRLLRLVG